MVNKTRNPFSCIPLDQAHEQNNKLVKDSGGAVGLTENPSAFRRWMIAGPEQARLLMCQRLKAGIVFKTFKTDRKHSSHSGKNYTILF